MAGDNPFAPPSIVIAILTLFLGALLGDWVPDWRFKAFSIAAVFGLAIYLFEFFTGLAKRLDAVTSYCGLVPPILIGAVVLCVSLALLRPHARFEMLNFDPALPTFSTGQVVASLAEFINRGQEDGSVAIDNYVRTDVPTLPANATKAQQVKLENGIFDDFSRQSKIRDATLRHTIIPGDRLWMLAQGTHLPADQVQGFDNGTLTFYFMGTIRYRDSNQGAKDIRYADYCQYVVKDATTGAIGIYPCRVHNSGRKE